MLSKINLLFIIFALTAGLKASGQDTTYHTDNGNKVNTLQAADFYKVLQRNPADTNQATEKSYFKSGKLRSEGSLSNCAKVEYNGEYKSYYENGQLNKIIHYNHGKIDGTLITYWKDGTLKRQDEFNDGKFIKGTCYNEQGKPITHFAYEQMPEFPGGEPGLVHYLSSRIRYPSHARKKNITGTVIAQFVIDKQGNLANLTITQHVGDDLDAEALRVIKAMPRWKPGIQDGELVAVKYNLPIRFVLQ